MVIPHPPGRLRLTGARALPWRELVWVAAGQIASIFGVAVGVRVITGLLVPGVYGEVALDITIATLLAQVILGPVGHASERFFASSLEIAELPAFLDSLKRLLAKACLLLLGCGAAVAVCAWLIAPERALGMGLAATAFALLSGLESVFDSTQNAARRRVLVAAHQGLRSCLRPVCIAWMVGVFGPTSTAAIAGYTLASGGVLVSQVAASRRLLGPRLATPSLVTQTIRFRREMLSYALPFALWGFLAWIQASSDRWSLQVFENADQVGLYAIVFQLGAYPIAVLFTILGQLAAPIVFATAGDATNPIRVRSALRSVELIASGLTAATVAVALITLVGHDTIFRLLVAPEYAHVAYLLPLAVLGSGLLHVGYVVGWTALVVRRPHGLLVPRLGSTAMTLLLNAVGASSFGVPGVLVAGVASAIAYSGWTALTCIRLAGSFFREQPRQPGGVDAAQTVVRSG